ncbi:hypothetical protein MPER_09960, partial [Moniliophthora perniciosa FA553]
MPQNSSIRRRKPKFKLTRQNQHKVKENRNYPVPTDKEWKAMKIFARMKLDDDEGQTIDILSSVTVLSPDARQSKDGCLLPLSKIWMARIEGIRQRENNGEVWLKVQWFYTPEDVKTVIENFHRDIIHSTPLDELVEVKYLVGGGAAIIKEPSINSEDVYYRYNLEVARKKLKADYF